MSGGLLRWQGEQVDTGHLYRGEPGEVEGADGPDLAGDFRRGRRKTGSEVLKTCKDGDKAGTRRMLMGLFGMRYDFA